MELNEVNNKNKKPYIWIGIAVVCAIILLLWFQHSQLFQYGLNNATVEKDSVDLFASAYTPIITNIGIIGSLYMYHRQASTAEKQTPFIERQASAAEKQASIMEKQASYNEKSNLENKSFEFIQHYSRAIDQLGSEKMEIRLGAISALEIIANKSSDYYWPIMKTLTAYIKKNSALGDKENKISLDIQAILDVIRGHEFSDFKDSNVLDLQGTFLRKANLERANLEGANLENATLVEANLIEANLSKANLIKAIFIQANLKESNLEKAKLNGAWLMGANLERAKLNEANLEGAKLSDPLNHTITNLEDANLERAKLNEANLEGANLQGAKLEKANLLRANLKKANIQVANLKCAALMGANLEIAALMGAKLESASLWGANLKMANLEECNLLNAYFKGANLEGVNLLGANLKKANFEEANLKMANLRGTINLTVDQLCKAKTLYKAQLDPELEIPLKEKFPHLFEEPGNEN